MSHENRQLDSESLDPRERRADEAIRQAVVAELPVPRGLGERILGKLAEARTASLPPCAAAANESATLPTSTPVELAKPEGSPGWSWRWVAGVALAVTLLVGGLGAWYYGSTTLTSDAILNAGLEWRNVKQLETNPWAVVTEQVQNDYPYPYRVLSAKPSAWQSCTSSEIGASGVVFRVQAPGIKRGYLFVLQAGRSITGLGDAPQPQPLRSTGGWSLAAWQQDDRVYVLLAEGSAPAFRQLIRYAPIAA